MRKGILVLVMAIFVLSMSVEVMAANERDGSGKQLKDGSGCGQIQGEYYLESSRSLKAHNNQSFILSRHFGWPERIRWPSLRGMVPGRICLPCRCL